MTAKQKKLQAILDRMVADSKEAKDLAVEIYGEAAHLFEESNCLFAMSGDCDGHARERQEYIKQQGVGYYHVGGGAW